MKHVEQPTSETPYLEVVTRGAYVHITYDFWRCRCDLTREAGDSIAALFRHAVRETFRCTKRRKEISFGGGPVHGYVTVDRRLADALIAEMKQLFLLRTPLKVKWWPDLGRDPNAPR